MSITLLALQNLVNSFHGRITVLACGNSRFSSLFAAVELGETAVFAGCQHPSRVYLSPCKHFWLAQPGELGQGETIRTCASVFLGSGKVFSFKRSLKFTLLGEWASRENFSPCGTLVHKSRWGEWFKLSFEYLTSLLWAELYGMENFRLHNIPREQGFNFRLKSGNRME